MSDPHSNLPPAARKAAKEANRLVEEQRVNMTANARPGFVPASSVATPPATPGVAAQPVVETPPVDEVAELKHKLSVLTGKYNAEVPRLQGAAQALASENERLQRLQVEQARARPAAPTPRAEDQFDLSVVTAKEREEFGEELVQIMARIAKANSSGANTAELTALKNELASMRGAVAQTQQIGAQTRMEKVWQALDAQIGAHWRVLNDSQQYLDWLAKIDIMSGRPRSAGLTEAFEIGDSARVVEIFKRFIQEDSSARPTSDGRPVSNVAQVSQETLVAPAAGRGSGEGAPNGTSGRVYSEQDIDDFYSRVQRKRISPEEKALIEADLQAAVREGRVIPRRDDRHLANSR